jgi:uncharacterized membrane protein (DUF4010 family)
MSVDIYIRLGIALGLGLLIGLQRERVDKHPGGIRTFALISLFGAISSLLSDSYGEWVLAATFLSLTTLISVSNCLALKKNPQHGTGLTSEIAALLTFAIAAYLMHGDKSVAVVCAGVIALLLHYKNPLHNFIGRMSKGDVQAIMQFVLISLVILPILPNKTYDPFEVLNPFKIWLMVVLIVGIGLFGYVAYKLFSAKAGTLLGGILGGLISSTATTIGSARDTKNAPSRATAAAMIIMIATAISISRVLLEIFAVANEFFLTILPPFAVLLGVILILTFILYRRNSDEIIHLDEPENPAQLKPAIIFGLLYAVILLAVAATQEHIGEHGLYVVAVLSGLTDVDAITLSTAELLNKQQLEVGTGWRLIMTATLANTLFKGGAVAVLGASALFKRIAILYGIAIATGVALIFLWPK